jgi:hypothetical protein
MDLPMSQMERLCTFWANLTAKSELSGCPKTNCDNVTGAHDTLLIITVHWNASIAVFVQSGKAGNVLSVKSWIIELFRNKFDHTSQWVIYIGINAWFVQ